MSIAMFIPRVRSSGMNWGSGSRLRVREKMFALKNSSRPIKPTCGKHKNRGNHDSISIIIVFLDNSAHDRRNNDNDKTNIESIIISDRVEGRLFVFSIDGISRCATIIDAILFLIAS